MVDVVDSAKRSQMMSGIRGKNTKPEILVRKALFARGFRYRLHDKHLPGKPDIVLSKYRVAIFVHGCYWHKHDGCKLAYSNRDYSETWIKKFKNNIKRDKQVLNELLESKWRVSVIWECATRENTVFVEQIDKLAVWIKSGTSQYFESKYKKT